jgi:hypothetical protein
MRILVVGFGIALLVGGCTQSSRSADGGQRRAPGGGAIPVRAASVSKHENSSGRTGAAPQLSAQPEAPQLPDDVGLDTSEVELGAAALIAAQRELDSGVLGSLAVADRHAFIFDAWYPQMIERQARLQKIADARARAAGREADSARRRNQQEARLAETEERYQARIAEERRKTVPIDTDIEP